MESESKKLEELAKKHRIAFKAVAVSARGYGSFTTVFKRSGWSYSKRLTSLVVHNNAIRLKVQKAQGEVPQHSPRASARPTSDSQNETRPQGQSKIGWSQEHTLGRSLEDRYNPRITYTSHGELPGREGDMTTQSPSLLEGRERMEQSSPPNRSGDMSTSVADEERKRMRTINAILHPHLPEEIANQKLESMVPNRTPA
jgi:hypothetical protein